MIASNASSDPTPRPSPPYLAAIVLAVAYGLGAWISSSMSDSEVGVMNFWIPGGILAGALLLQAQRYWPMLIIAAGIGDFGYNILGPDSALWGPNSYPLIILLLLHLGNSFGAVASVMLVQKFFAPQLTLKSVQELVGLIILVAGLGSAMAAAIGTAVVWGMGNTQNVGSTWIVWASSDALGVLLIVPLMLVWQPQLALPRWRRPTARQAEFMALAAGLIAVQGSVFHASSAYIFVAHYIAIPFQIWAVIRFGLRGVTVASLITALLTGWFSSQGLIAAMTPQRGTELQISLAMYAFSGLLLAVVFEANRRTEQALRQSQKKVTQLHRSLSDRVKDRTAELEAAVQELESFSYSVAHDLRSPLRGIEGWSHALNEDYRDQLNPQGKDHLDRVRTETRMMGTTIDDLLNLARVNRINITVETVDLTPLAKSIIAQHQATQSTPATETVIPPHLEAQCDPQLARLLLQKLLDNAWKFTRLTAVPRIEIGRAETVNGPAFFVRDNGAGFDLADAAKLFTPFNRLHKPSEFPGTGVGLAIVERVTRCHGGMVWAEAAVDQGATFFFTLPDPVSDNQIRTTPSP